MLKTHSYKIFCKDILTRKRILGGKITLFLPQNCDNREKKRTLPLGSEEGFGNGFFWRVKKCIY